ncbi:ionotropic receptor 60e [Dermatophagoides pteronyssinus]|uniref:ionotropic receptor 60e n=1 Tax=Dermatophagoides pteronyssinus TaxID=6956 RepID=UPI003F67728B
MIVLSPAYCASFYSILTIPEYERPMDTTNDILKALQDDYFKIICLKFSSYYDLFVDSPKDLTTLYMIGQHLKRSKENMTESTEEGIDIVQNDPNGRYIYIDSKLTLSFLSKLIAKKPLHVGQGSFGVDFISVALAKHSPFGNVIDHYVQILYESNLSQAWFYKIIMEIEKYHSLLELSSSKTLVDNGVKLIHVYSIFILFFIGNLCSIFVFLAEISYRKIISIKTSWQHF